jgi:glucose/arabinose dehydrogenase
VQPVPDLRNPLIGSITLNWAPRAIAAPYFMRTCDHPSLGETMTRFTALLLVLALPAMAMAADMPAGYGPAPDLPKPDQGLFPTVNIAPAAQWREGAGPTPAPGLRVMRFADGLAHPRWLHVLPNGDVLVAETGAPRQPEDGKGLKGFVARLIMSRAGAVVKSADRITLLRDADGDGVAELRTHFIQGLHSPVGMALIGDTLFVANTNAILAFPYVPGATRIEAKGRVLTELPGGLINHHWTKTLQASADGRFLFATVGSNSNIAENGLEAEEGRAAIWRIEVATGQKRLFATGLRNPVGMDIEPTSGALWTAVNERDEIGDDLPPDYMTAVQDGGFYGWPWSYYGPHVDPRVTPARPDMVATALAPDYALGGHTAPLGLAFSRGAAAMPAAFADGAFVGQHGSWNRSDLSGYAVIFIPFANGVPAGPPRDVLTGFVDARGDAQGRPVGVAIAGDGALLAADDVGNAVWRVDRAPN